MTAYYFVEPTDSVFLRGNLDFGDAGEHGASMMPPLPSLFAGAFRSAILGRDSTALTAFIQRGQAGNDTMHRVLGSFVKQEGAPFAKDSEGTFRIAWLSLAGLSLGQSKPMVEAISPVPADLVVMTEDSKGKSDDSGDTREEPIEFARLKPSVPNSLVAASQTLPFAALLRTPKQAKPNSGYYLRDTGLAAHLAGQALNPAHALKKDAMHKRDPRLGIGLNSDSRTVESGLIYTTEGYAFSPKQKDDKEAYTATGFLVGISGAEDLLPESGFLRLGGDGRSAAYRRIDYAPPSVDLAGIGESSRFRLILQTPGVFVDGWVPNGVTKNANGEYRLAGEGFSARLACAAVPRREVISGWDLLNWKPKDAERVAPAGSVYWFDEFEGDAGKLAEWVNAGLWSDNPNTLRRAEGFNLAVLAAWPH